MARPKQEAATEQSFFADPENPTLHELNQHAQAALLAQSSDAIAKPIKGGGIDQPSE